jgi:hypothetical protein
VTVASRAIGDRENVTLGSNSPTLSA